MQVSFGLEKSIPQKGKLTVDNEGFYSVVLGGFNITSANGPHYELDDAVASLFGPGSDLETRLNQHLVESEHDHPDYSKIPGNTVEEVNGNYMQRLLVIEPSLVCGEFKDVKLVPTTNREYGATENIVEVHGKFKPKGPYGAEVKRQLDDPDINTAFSLRCWRRCSEMTGRKVCKVTIPVTWDFVPLGLQPGISLATKENSIGLETLMSGGIELTDTFIGDLTAGLESIHDETLKKQVAKVLNPCKGDNCFLNW